MLLLDPHIHTSGISRCSKCPAEMLVDICVRDKIDAIVLTNHYKRNYYVEDDKFAEWRKKYIDEYLLTRREGEKRGLKVFFGLEITLDYVPKVDFLVYGLSHEVASKAPALHTFTQRELFEYCVSENALLYQAHPYRNGTQPQDPRYLHGVEINCHPIYNRNDKEEIIAFAKEHSLKLSCGSDYHGDTYKAHCGIYIPKDISDTVELAEFLRRKRQCQLEIHDIIPDWRKKHTIGEVLTR